MDQPVHRSLAKETTSPRQVPPTPIVTTVFQATEDVPKYDKQSSATWILRCSENQEALWQKYGIFSLEAPSRWNIAFFLKEYWTPEYPPERRTHIPSPLQRHIGVDHFPAWDPFGGRYGRSVPWENILHWEVPFEGFKWNLQAGIVELAPNKNPRNRFSQEATMKYFTTKDESLTQTFKGWPLAEYQMANRNIRKKARYCKPPSRTPPVVKASSPKTSRRRRREMIFQAFKAAVGMKVGEWTSFWPVVLLGNSQKNNMYPEGSPVDQTIRGCFFCGWSM